MEKPLEKGEGQSYIEFTYDNVTGTVDELSYI